MVSPYKWGLSLFGLVVLILNSYGIKAENSVYLTKGQANNIDEIKKNSCDLKSELIPGAILKFIPRSKTSNYGDYISADESRFQLYFKEKLIENFSIVHSQGYGSRFWSVLNKDYIKGGEVIYFKGGYPLRSYPKVNKLKGNLKILFIGMGRYLYYEGFRWRNNQIVDAGNGFWLLEKECIP